MMDLVKSTISHNRGLLGLKFGWKDWEQAPEDHDQHGKEFRKGVARHHFEHHVLLSVTATRVGACLRQKEEAWKKSFWSVAREKTRKRVGSGARVPSSTWTRAQNESPPRWKKNCKQRTESWIDYTQCINIHRLIMQSALMYTDWLCTPYTGKLCFHQLTSGHQSLLKALPRRYFDIAECQHCCSLFLSLEVVGVS